MAKLHNATSPWREITHSTTAFLISQTSFWLLFKEVLEPTSFELLDAIDIARRVISLAKIAASTTPCCTVGYPNELETIHLFGFLGKHLVATSSLIQLRTTAVGAFVKVCLDSISTSARTSAANRSQHAPSFLESQRGKRLRWISTRRMLWISS